MVWCGGARETQERGTAIKMENCLRSPCFFRSQWYLLETGHSLLFTFFVISFSVFLIEIFHPSRFIFSLVVIDHSFFLLSFHFVQHSLIFARLPIRFRTDSDLFTCTVFVCQTRNFHWVINWVVDCTLSSRTAISRTLLVSFFNAFLFFKTAVAATFSVF